MRELLPRLLELRELDKAIRDLQAQLDVYPRLIAQADARRRAAAEKLAGAQSLHAEARERRRKADLDVKALRERIQKYLLQQAQVRTNQEYAALTAEIDGVKAEIDRVETHGLAALEDEERAEAAAVEAQAALREVEAETRRERERMDAQIADKRQRLAAYRTERASQMEGLPDDVRELYELLNERYPGAGVVAVDQGVCGGCGFQLVSQKLLEVRRGRDLIRCDHCLRILYSPEALEAGSGRPTGA